MNAFGCVVKKYLIDHNLQQIDIVQNSDMTKQTISKLLNRDNISLEKMLLIADALDCKLSIQLIPKNEKE